MREKRGGTMSYLTQDNLSALETTATTAAAYLDACDSGALFTPLDPAYYRACGTLLLKIFQLLDTGKEFTSLLEQSAAAREVSESILITRHLELNTRVFYPELSVLMKRAAT